MFSVSLSTGARAFSIEFLDCGMVVFHFHSGQISHLHPFSSAYVVVFHSHICLAQSSFLCAKSSRLAPQAVPSSRCSPHFPPGRPIYPYLDRQAPFLAPFYSKNV